MRRQFGMDLRRAWGMLFQAADDKLIAICGDYENRPPRRQGESIVWPFARFMVVGIMAGLFVSLFIKNYMMSDTTSTNRVYREKYLFQKQSFFRYDSDGSEYDLQLADGSMSVTCPCYFAVSPLRSFMELFIFDAAAAKDNISRTKERITDSASFCSVAQGAFWNESNDSEIYLSESFCAAINHTLGDLLYEYNEYNDSYDFADGPDMGYWRKVFVSPVMMDKRSLIVTSVSQMLNMLDRKRDTVRLDMLEGRRDTVSSLDYAAYNLVFNSFYSTLRSYLLWNKKWLYSYNGFINEPYDPFYNYTQNRSKAQAVVGATSTTITWNLSFAVNINWNTYYVACSPPYCDISDQISTRRRFYSVLAELGGLVAIALLIVQALLWPWLSCLIDWTKAAAPNLAVRRNVEEENRDVFVSGNDDNGLSTKWSSNPQSITGVLVKDSSPLFEVKGFTPFGHTKHDIEENLKKWSSNKW